ncbi:MAG: SH3 domain-containing protein [Actinomycetota bacterium]|nr:SH3 domain-containing protein [Actinomycetota bacterium]MDD5666621.1 SH3 domain-containing protein [Actinomycetota bacterium]
MGSRGGQRLPASRKYRVIASHKASYPEALVFAAGDVLEVEERETVWEGWIWCVKAGRVGAWVPEEYIERRGSRGTALRDYDSIELSVDPGDVLEACDEVAGWLWCADRDGRRGWVPRECVEPLGEY